MMMNMHPASFIREFLKKEKNVHLLFQLSLIVKGVIAMVELLSGIVLYYVSQGFLLNVVGLVTQDELQEDPHDLISNFLLHTTQNLSISTQHFTALYLIGHGVVKLFIIAGLLREKLWYYPTGLVVFGLFLIYELYRFSFTHSILLLLIAALDVIVMWLTWHEYTYLRKKLLLRR